MYIIYMSVTTHRVDIYCCVDGVKSWIRSAKSAKISRLTEGWVVKTIEGWVKRKSTISRFAIYRCFVHEKLLNFFFNGDNKMFYMLNVTYLSLVIWVRKDVLKIDDKYPSRYQITYWSLVRLLVILAIRNCALICVYHIFIFSANNANYDFENICR